MQLNWLGKKCRRAARIATVVGLIGAALTPVPVPALAAGECDPPITNPIPCENSKAGAPSTEWEVAGSGDTDLAGFQQLAGEPLVRLEVGAALAESGGSFDR